MHTQVVGHYPDAWLPAQFEAVKDVMVDLPGPPLFPSSMVSAGATLLTASSSAAAGAEPDSSELQSQSQSQSQPFVAWLGLYNTDNTADPRDYLYSRKGMYRHFTREGSEPGVVMMLFSVVSRATLEEVKKKWVPEIKSHKPTSLPFMLVGIQTELRDEGEDKCKDQRETPISTEEGERVARSLGAACYVECSAKTGKGLANVLECAVIVALSTAGLIETTRSSSPPPSSSSRGTSFLGSLWNGVSNWICRMTR